MHPDEPSADFAAAYAWQATVVLGVATLILGLIVTIYPSATLNVIAVLFGLLMIVSGLFHLVRVFVSHEAHRVWMGISGLLLVVIGVVLLRDLHLTVALIGLIIGVTWIVQGMTALIVGFSGGEREGRGWWIFFGAGSLIGGVVVTGVATKSGAGPGGRAAAVGGGRGASVPGGRPPGQLAPPVHVHLPWPSRCFTRRGWGAAAGQLLD